jgi:DNA-nicking Smr family endonuclease
MSKKNNRLHELEKMDFRNYTKDVKPLAQTRAEPFHHRPGPIPRQRYLDEQEVIESMLSDITPDDIETGDELIFARPGVQHNLLRKLRRGHFAVEAELDLHGHTVAEAKIALVGFLFNIRAKGMRCVRIIHGKGNGSFQKQPILKRKVDYWLRQRQEVLAFSSARPQDGGTGAIYLLIRKNRA